MPWWRRTARSVPNRAAESRPTERPPDWYDAFRALGLGDAVRAALGDDDSSCDAVVIRLGRWVLVSGESAPERHVAHAESIVAAIDSMAPAPATEPDDPPDRVVDGEHRRFPVDSTTLSVVLPPPMTNARAERWVKHLRFGPEVSSRVHVSADRADAERHDRWDLRSIAFADPATGIARDREALAAYMVATDVPGADVLDGVRGYGTDRLEFVGRDDPLREWDTAVVEAAVALIPHLDDVAASAVRADR